MNVLGISGLDNNVRFKKGHFPDLSPREYRIAQGFDSAAALVSDGRIRAAAAQERFSREKATGAFPAEAMKYCMEEAGIGPTDIDFLAHGFSYEPFKAHFQHDDFLKAQYEGLYQPSLQLEALNRHFPGVDWTKKFTPVPHHLAHAASAFDLSGFPEALILITDGMGEIHSMTALVGSPQGMEIIRQVPALHSAGVLYGVFTLYLGFFMGLDEYKVMGLAPYGDPRRHYDKMMEFVRLKEDGTYAIPLLAQDKTILEKETHAGVLRTLEETFGPRREPGSEITQFHKDVASALQAVLETIQLHLLRTLKDETGLENLCMAGGVALNCTANGVIKRSRLFEQTFVQPASGDDGTSLGAALYVNRANGSGSHPASMTVPLWGPEFREEDIAETLSGSDGCRWTRFDSFQALAVEAARRVEGGEIIAWFQGRMEFGPRALGNRSILADPRRADMRDMVNARIKKREGFRPFAPAVADEEAARYFEVDEGDEATYAHMLYVTPVRPAFRDALPAITHVNGTARIQTVSRDENPRFWTFLDEFRQLSGMAVVLNTSFNVRGQPIVCTPQEAIDTFLMANLDALVIGDYLVLPESDGTEGDKTGEEAE